MFCAKGSKLPVSGLMMSLEANDFINGDGS